jgi:hypothetical protein
MRILTAILLFSFSCYGQDYFYGKKEGQGKGSLYFDAAINLNPIILNDKNITDIHFAPYFTSAKKAYSLNLGIGWYLENGLTLGFKTNGTMYEWSAYEYYRELENTYTNSYVYPGEESGNSINNGINDLGCGLEIGYLKTFDNISIKPNFEFGIFGMTLVETPYAVRLNTENLVTYVKMSPTTNANIYLQPTIDISLNKIKRLFLHLGYFYSPLNIEVLTSETSPKGVYSETNSLNQYHFHKIVLGLKFALL